MCSNIYFAAIMTVLIANSGVGEMAKFGRRRPRSNDNSDGILLCCRFRTVLTSETCHIKFVVGFPESIKDTIS